MTEDAKDHARALASSGKPAEFISKRTGLPQFYCEQISADYARHKERLRSPARTSPLSPVSTAPSSTRGSGWDTAVGPVDRTAVVVGSRNSKRRRQMSQPKKPLPSGRVDVTGHKIVLDGYRIDKKTGKPVKVEKRVSRPAQYARRKKQTWKAAAK